jgi:hypothetical protein
MQKGGASVLTSRFFNPKTGIDLEPKQTPMNLEQAQQTKGKNLCYLC